MSYVENIKDKLLKALQNKLPGHSSHIKMMPESRLNMSYDFDINNVKKSAVLLLLFPENKTYKLIFIKRAEDNGSHSGQIAFPGGKVEISDKDLEYTALRETEEEIGIKKENVRIIRGLTPLFIPVSKFLVYPFVGIIDYFPKLCINKKEVQDVYFADFKIVVSAEKTEKYVSTRNEKITAPFYVFKEFEIWGASAMILSEFADLLKKDFN